MQSPVKEVIDLRLTFNTSFPDWKTRDSAGAQALAGDPGM
jgi:hypothetical protein